MISSRSLALFVATLSVFAGCGAADTYPAGTQFRPAGLGYGLDAGVRVTAPPLPSSPRVPTLAGAAAKPISAEISSRGAQQTRCQQYGDCQQCAPRLACQWCLTRGECIPLTDRSCPAVANGTSECRERPADCASCVAQPHLDWCESTHRCIEENEGLDACPPGARAHHMRECPRPNCPSFRDCASCAAVFDCVWCSSSSSCGWSGGASCSGWDSRRFGGCSPVCRAPTQWDGTRCACPEGSRMVQGDPSGGVGPGAYLNPSMGALTTICECDPPRVFVNGGCACPAGSWNGTTCGCPTGQTFDAAARRCVPRELCPTGMTLQGMPSNPHCECNQGTRWAPASRTCVRDECTGGTVYDAQRGHCACPAGQQWSARSRRCLPGCAAGLVFNGSDDSCNCPVGATWVPTSRTCVTCVPGAAWNGTRCECTSATPILTGNRCEPCPGNQHWNGSVCACPPNMILTAGRCQCPQGQVWSGNACVPTRTEAPGNSGGMPEYDRCLLVCQQTDHRCNCAEGSCNTEYPHCALALSSCIDSCMRAHFR